MSPSENLHPVSWKAAGAASLLALLFLGLSVEPSAYWGDSASFASHLDTTPKPFARSYWLYKLLGRLLVGAGFPPPAAAGYASALFASLAVGLLHALTQRLGGGLAAAGLAAGSLCVAQTFWLHGTVAEVYSLVVLLELGLVFLVLGAPTRQEEAFGFGALVGLCLNHHRLLFFAFPILAWFLWRAASPGQRRKCLSRVALGLTLGSLPWVLLCLTHPPSSLAPSAAIDQNSLWLQKVFLGGRWSGSQMAGLGAGSLLAGLLYLVKLIPLNFPSPAGLLALLGLRALRRVSRARRELLVGLLCTFVVAGSLFGWTGDQYAFFSPLLPLTALLAGLGLTEVLGRFPRRGAPVLLALSIAMPPAVYATLTLGPGTADLSPGAKLERQEFIWPPKAGYDFPEAWARDRLAELPPNATLVSQWAEGTVVQYLQKRGLRGDVTLILHRSGPLDLAALEGPVFVSWKPTRAEPPEAFRHQGLTLKGNLRGLREVVLPEPPPTETSREQGASGASEDEGVRP